MLERKCYLILFLLFEFRPPSQIMKRPRGENVPTWWVQMSAVHSLAQNSEKSSGARLHFGCVARLLIYLEPKVKLAVMELDLGEWKNVP